MLHANGALSAAASSRSHKDREKDQEQDVKQDHRRTQARMARAPTVQYNTVLCSTVKLTSRKCSTFSDPREYRMPSGMQPSSWW